MSTAKFGRRDVPFGTHCMEGGAHCRPFGTDVAKDLDDFGARRSIWDPPDQQRYQVNGRTYAVEPSGTVFPEAGPGLTRLNRAEYGALKEYIAGGGDIEKAKAEMACNPILTEAAQERALDVLRRHKSYRG